MEPLYPALPGELRFLEADATRHLALVLTTYTSHLVFALAHPYTEYATEHDLVLPPELTGARYELAVCPDTVGTAFSTQLDPSPVGKLPYDLLGPLRRFRLPPYTGDARWWSGPRLLGPLDARWELKAELREIAARLSAPSLEFLLA